MSPTKTTLLLLLGGCALQAAGCKRAEAPSKAVPSTPTQGAPSVSGTTAAVPPAIATTELPETIARPSEPKVDWRAQLEQLGPPSLIVLTQDEGGCDWTTLRPPDLEARLFLSTPACPSELAWDRRGGRAAFPIEDLIYVYDWQNAQITEVPSPGVANPQVGFSARGALLACSYEPVPAATGGAYTYRVTFELADGAWKKIGFENFGMEAFDTVCSNADDAENSGEMHYNPRVQTPLDCPLEDGAARTSCPSRAVLEDVSARMPTDQAFLRSIQYVPFGQQRFLAYRFLDLQVATAEAPLFAIENDTVTEIYQRLPADEDIEVLFGVDHFLVTKRREMTHATLFKSGQIEPVKEFADEARVMWIPGAIPPAEIISLEPRTSADEE